MGTEDNKSNNMREWQKKWRPCYNAESKTDREQTEETSRKESHEFQSVLSFPLPRSQKWKSEVF